VFLGLTFALPLLKASAAGSVINISSVAGLRSNPGEVAYSSSKHAVGVFLMLDNWYRSKVSELACWAADNSSV